MESPADEFEIGLACVHRGGLWLVARRPAHVHLGGLWEFPGGKCESGESPREAALRELHEECGVNAHAERILPVVTQTYPERVVHLTPVICDWRDGEPAPHEAEECRWVTLEQMRTLEMPAANAEVLEELHRYAAARQ